MSSWHSLNSAQGLTYLWSHAHEPDGKLKVVLAVRLLSAGLEHGPLMGYNENGYESWAFIKAGNFLTK
jgi:hypothetical protein